MSITNSSRNVADCTTNMSMAAMPIASLRRKLRQVGDGVRGLRTMYFATVAWSDLDAKLQQLAVDARRTLRVDWLY